MNIKSAYLEITNQCNLNCKTCYNRSGLKRAVKELTLEQIKHTIAVLSDMGCSRFLFAGGEPLLHSAFDGLLAWIKEKPDLLFGIVTNGTIYSQQLIDSYQACENIDLQISLDGSCEESNSKTRGRGNFAKTERFLKAIRHASKRPLVKMVISNSNLDDVADFYGYVLKMGGIPEYAFINKMGNGSKDWENKLLSGGQKFQVFQLINELNHQHGENVFLPECSFGCPMDLEDNPFSFLVKVNGDIQPCQLLYDECFTLTNIFAFQEKQMEKNLKKISDSVSKRANTPQEYCDKCFLQSGCKKGCLAAAYNYSNDPLGPDGDCQFRIQQFIHYHLNKQSAISAGYLETKEINKI